MPKNKTKRKFKPLDQYKGPEITEDATTSLMTDGDVGYKKEIEEDKPNTDSLQDIPSDWKVESTNDIIVPDCSQVEIQVKRSWNPDASEFKPKSYSNGSDEQAGNRSYLGKAKKSNTLEQLQSDDQERKGTGNEIMYSQDTVEDTNDRRDGNVNYHQRKTGFDGSGYRSRPNQYGNSNRRDQHEYSDKNRWLHQNKSTDERGQGRFSSNSWEGGKSKRHGGKNEPFDQRERKPSVGKRYSTSTKSDRGELQNVVFEQKGYEGPAVSSARYHQNDSTWNEYQNIESISEMNIRDVDNNGTKNPKFKTSLQDSTTAQDVQNLKNTGMYESWDDETAKQDEPFVEFKSKRQWKRTPQNPHGLSDPRMKRETESKKQGDENWGQTKKFTGRKQSNFTPSLKDVDNTERTEKQNTNHQDEDWHPQNDSTTIESYDGWTDKTTTQEISESVPEEENEGTYHNLQGLADPEIGDTERTFSGFKDDHFSEYPKKQNKGRKSYPEFKPKLETDRKSLGKRAQDSEFEMSTKENYDRSYEKTDVEYREFNDKFRWNTNFDYVKVTEKEQDLFELAKDNSYSLGHCVAEDLRMGSGIAVYFKREFKEVDELLSQRQKQGGLAVLENNNRYIYYLITKRISTGKPTYETFWSSLKKLREHVSTHGVQKLAIPRIGCGLDRLEWVKVKFMIEFLFRDVNVEIVVCNFQQMEDTPQKPTQSTRLVYHHEPLKDIDEYTIILYLSTEDGHVSKEMETLDEKFKFLPYFGRSSKKLGIPIRYETKNYILYGCIVKENPNDLFDFKSFAKCLAVINKNNRKDQYEYIALEPVHDNEDDLLNEKVITLLRNFLSKVDIYICSDKTSEEQ